VSTNDLGLLCLHEFSAWRNYDYYGRPQIQPFVSYFTTNDKSGFGGEYGDSDSEVVFGVKGEVWF